MFTEVFNVVITVTDVSIPRSELIERTNFSAL